LAKPNYRHAKKQKEAARKARQDAKHQRKNTPDAPGTSDAVEPTTDEVVGSTAEEILPAGTIA
jgi:hypothetical protein